MTTKEFISPSGKYKLRYTPKDSWESRGEVFKQGDGKPFEVVDRNYRSFPFEWIEDHADGHSYLVCGADYQGQTVIQLDTGKRLDFLPPEAKEGHGFCWSFYTYDPKTQILFVDGCYWACPYEWRLYDFSNPLEFKHLKILDKEGEEILIENSAKKPTVEGDVVTFYKVRSREDYEEYYEVPPPEAVVWETIEDEEYTVVSTQTFKLKDGCLHQEASWASDVEKAYCERQDEAHRKYEERVATFKATDPLYLAFVEGIKDPAFSPEPYVWQGVTHENWCSEWKGNEPRWGRDVVTGPRRITVEWAEISGPILVVTYPDGKASAKVFREHSVESMRAAMAYAKKKALDV